MKSTASKWRCDYILEHVDAGGHILGISKIDIIYPEECTLHSMYILYTGFSYNSKLIRVICKVNWKFQILILTFVTSFSKSDTLIELEPYSGPP